LRPNGCSTFGREEEPFHEAIGSRIRSHSSLQAQFGGHRLERFFRQRVVCRAALRVTTRELCEEMLLQLRSREVPGDRRTRQYCIRGVSNSAMSSPAWSYSSPVGCRSGLFPVIEERKLLSELDGLLTKFI